jgi:N-acetylglutamate synthase-like GNAT family acetyltransferase
MDVYAPLAQEVERVLYAASAAWEGVEVQETALGVGEIILRAQPGFTVAMPLHFDPVLVEEQLDQAIEQVEKLYPRCMWVVGPGSQPADLEQRFMLRNFVVFYEWDGLALTNLSLSLPTTPGIVIEPLSWENAEAYASAIAGESASPRQALLLANAQRYLRRIPQEVQIFVAWLDGAVAGYATLRVEPNGVAYLRNAMTVPTFRQRGVYLSLVAHRLAQARMVGCTTAVVQALIKTSAPILVKRGFTRVCRIVGLVRKAPPSSH